ncbi:hypothetical protein LTR95_011634 [Oleoguttula sp. CCFEE 5521]
MYTTSSSLLLLPATLVALVAASPAPNAARPRDPLITPTAVLHDASPTWKRPRDVWRRNIISDVASYGDSILSGLGSDLPSWVASGVPNFFQDFPTGDKVQSSLGIDDAQVSALPTQVLNLDPYANYTDQGWQVRFRGNVYKQPNTNESKLNDLANIFLIDTSIEDLPQSQQEQARNVTASIFVLQQGNVNVSTIHLEPSPGQGSSGEQGGGGATTATGGTQDITLPYETTDQGDFDVFVPINSNGLTPGNATSQVQRLNTYVDGASIGNATAYLVPNQGLTFISDIDDILRVTKIYEPKEGLLNSFARPFVAWENMPQIYANWSKSLPDAHFHYLTTTPEQVTRTYMEFIYATYPGGSFDTRPLNFSDISATLSIRMYLLEKIFATFPQRKFVLVADTSNSDEHPNQVQCIFLRNTSATDPGDKFPYDTSGFETLNQKSYMFFLNADDLTGLDIEGGNCYNSSIAQNLTFGYQGLPFGIGNDAPVNGSANGTVKGAAGRIAGGSAWTWLGAVVIGAVVSGLL